MRLHFDDKFDQMAEVLSQNNYYASEKDCEDLFLKLHDKVYEKLA